MNLNGKILLHSNSGFEYSDCNLVIKYGKIQELDVEKANALQEILFSEIKKSDFTIEKHYDVKKSPYHSNYIIKYGYGDPFLIYLKLDWWKIILLYYHSKKLLIQSDDMKKDMLKYLIGGFFGFLSTMILQYVSEVKVEKKPEPIVKQKILKKK